MESHINISYGKSAFKKLEEKLTSKQYSSVFVLVDNNTKAYCLNLFFQYFTTEVRTVLSFIAGEENKNLGTCEKLWKDLSSHGADRNSILINLGGESSIIVVKLVGGRFNCKFIMFSDRSLSLLLLLLLEDTFDFALCIGECCGDTSDDSCPV